jgi:hypothetical protein
VVGDMGSVVGELEVGRAIIKGENRFLKRVCKENQQFDMI